MPRYKANPTQISATFTTLPKEHYSFSIDSVKTYAQENKNGPSYGLQYGLTVINATDRALVGKKVTLRGQMENDMGQSAHKRFQMAAQGYQINADGEKAFNEANAAADFTFDTDANFVGKFYRSLVGKKFDADVDITLQDSTGREFQRWVTFSPFAG